MVRNMPAAQEKVFSSFCSRCVCIFCYLLWVKFVYLRNGWQLNSSAAFSGDRSMEKSNSSCEEVLLF